MAQGRRGYALEGMVEASNRTYENKGQALVHKVPTPWKVMYDKRTGRVKKAWPEEKGTVDFIGLAKGMPIAFDAKSTESKTSFPLKNIKPHQIHFLEQHEKQGGISFLLVEFSTMRQIYYFPFRFLKDFYEESLQGGRKSIPYDFFIHHCQKVTSKHGVLLDYLAHTKKKKEPKHDT